MLYIFPKMWQSLPCKSIHKALQIVYGSCHDHGGIGESLGTIGSYLIQDRVDP